MTTTRKTYSPKFKARVALEALRGEKTLSQLGSQYQVHPLPIAKWRKLAREQRPEWFVEGRRKSSPTEAQSTALYEEIGRLKVDWTGSKKSGPARLRTGVRWWMGGMRPSASGGSASCWV